MTFEKKVAVVWQLLGNLQICQDVKGKLQHLTLQMYAPIAELASKLTHALNVNTGQFIPAIQQRFVFHI